MKRIFIFLNSLFKNEKQTEPAAEDIFHVKNVQPGDQIKIEWYRIKTGIGPLLCLNNDPINKVILLQVSWGNYKETGNQQKEELILRYDAPELRNFKLLNEFFWPQQPFEPLQSKLEKLEEELEIALKEEKYEIITDLKKKIEEIKNQK